MYISRLFGNVSSSYELTGRYGRDNLNELAKPMATYKKHNLGTWVLVLVVITVVSVLVFASTYLFDTAGVTGASLEELIFSTAALQAMGNLPEVIAGVLGITITVVAIIVELAANRYTPRVTDLFVKSPTNLIVLGFFVVSCLMCIWISLIGSSPQFVPKIGVAVTLTASTLCLLMLLPYFAFVFNFLNPHNVIAYMGNASLKAISQARASQGSHPSHTKLLAVRGIEQLADVALNAIEHKDKGICMHAVDTLGALTRDYHDIKTDMPASWFTMDKELQENPDFVSMHKGVIDGIERNRYWLEMKVLRQYQMLYGETLNQMRDINYLIAINTRKLAEKAIADKDDRTTNLSVKFLNTYLRATINGKDVRTAYNVLNQYRLLAEYALAHGAYNVVVDAAGWFKYYGQLAFTTGLHFVLETAAHDLCRLNELAFDLDAPCKDTLLAIFLEVDKEAEEDHELEASLRGVRKAQIKLATYYLMHDADESAKTIFEDMKYELPSRLRSIRKELEQIDVPDFWEINDRGINFDYLEPGRRDRLDEFFGWFDTQRDPVTNGTSVAPA